MKTFRILGMALVAVMLGFAMSACSDDDDDYLKELEKEYARLIVGKWFNFTPESSVFKIFNADGTLKVVGFDNETGWMSDDGTWRLDGNKTTEKTKALDLLFSVVSLIFLIRSFQCILIWVIRE